MNITDFLELPTSHDFRLVAGEKGSTNDITGVNIMDNPFADDWLSAGELIVTSGYFFKESFEAQKKYFTRFKEMNVAGVCVKPQLFLKEISPNLKALCNELALPLIEIPYGIAFSKIIKTVMQKIEATLENEKQIALDIHSQFFETSLNSGGIASITKELRKIIANPVVIAASNWQIMAHEGLDEQLLGTLENRQNEYVFPRQLFNNLPVKTEKIKHPFYRNIEKNNKKILCCITPIYFNQTHYGYVIVYVSDRPLLNMDYIAIESCTMSLALEIVHQKEKNRIENRIYRDFLSDLLAGNFKTLEELKQLNMTLDYELNYAACIFTIRFPEIQNKSVLELRREEETMEQILSACQKYTQSNFLPFHLFKRGHQLVGILGTEKKLDTRSSQLQQTTILKKLKLFLEERFSNTFQSAMVIGSTQPLLSVNKSYDEAENILKSLSDDRNGIYFLNDLYLEAFLVKQISDPDSSAFIDYFLHHLIAYDQENNSNLLETLDVFLKNHHNIASASRDLFIHRNTLLYRLDRIKDILNYDFSDANHTLSLQLALKLYAKYT